MTSQTAYKEAIPDQRKTDVAGLSPQSPQRYLYITEKRSLVGPVIHNLNKKVLQMVRLSETRDCQSAHPYPGGK